MLKNFIKIAFRSLKRNSLHSIINISGLSIGIAASILILSYVYFEKSYDKFNTNFNHIYRVYNSISLPNGNKVEGPLTIGDLGPILQNDVPGILKASRIMAYRQDDLEVGEHRFTSDRIMYVDSTFFDIFDYKLIIGDKSESLKHPYSAVITKGFALKLYGKENAVNETFKINNDNYKITGILDDIPLNSHMQFELLASFSSVSNSKRDVVKESVFNFFTYVLCAKNAKLDDIEKSSDKVINDIVAKRLKGMGVQTNSRLQALEDVHLKSKSHFELEPPGDINTVYTFSFLAVFIIVIAIVNFINLVTANSENRAKEIGLRKVMGAFRQQLFIQFIGESLIICLLAFILALFTSELIIGSFRDLMESPIVIPYWENPFQFILLLAGLFIIGILAGLYPALYLSGFKPVKALKGSRSSTSKSNLLRKLLVVFQFCIAIFLMINLALLYKQIHYLKNKDMGFDKEQLLVVENISDNVRKSFLSIKADLLSNPNIKSVVGTRGVPGYEVGIEAIHNLGESVENSIAIRETRTQYDYFKTLGIDILKGRTFSKEMGTDKNGIVLNETAVKELGLKNPINKKVIQFDDTMTIIGVCRDYNYQSLHSKIQPMSHSIRRSYFNLIAIRLDTKDVKSTLASIENIFTQADPNLVFTYTFMDQKFDEMYRKEEKTNKLITYTAILAIIISLMGLFALTSFVMKQKTQEIGIRKVLGSSELSLTKMFISDISKWVIASMVIAIPLSYYSMNKWLEHFVYRTEIKIWMYAVACLLALAIAILTVGLLAYKAAKANPVDSLKYE